MTPENRVSKQPVNGEHHLKRTREPYYRIIEGNLPEIADEILFTPMRPGRWYDVKRRTGRIVNNLFRR